MRPSIAQVLVSVTLLIFVTGCTAPPELPKETATPVPTVDVEATVQARLKEERAKQSTPEPQAEVLTEASAAAKLLPSVVRISTSSGMGSGVAIADSLVITNRHVVEDEDTVKIETRDGQSLPGTIAARNSILDVALIRVEGLRSPAAALADLSRMKPGESVLAIGYPLDLKGDATVTRGLFSAVRVGQPLPGEWVQTDAAVNPGNSGGPLANLRGEVVGLITLRRTSDDFLPIQGINFALSSTSLKEVLPAMQVATGIVPQGAAPASVELSKEVGDFLQMYDAAESKAFSGADPSGLREIASPSLYSFVSAMIEGLQARNMRRESTLKDFRLITAFSLSSGLVVADVRERWESRTLRNGRVIEDDGETDQPQVAVVKKTSTGWQLVAVQFRDSETISTRPAPTPGR